MLCPEVWDFSPPASFSSFKYCESENDLFKAINNQYFNHHISIILPNTLQMPKDLISTIEEDSQYYKVSQVSIAEFFEKDFIDLFVRKGQLTAVSIEPPFEKNNCFAFVPNGHLILSLTKKTYQELEINSNFVKHLKGHDREFAMTIDLIHGCNSEKMLKNLCTNLKKSSNLFFDVVLIWEPDVAEICPSSIALYFSKKGYKVKMCKLESKHKHVYNVPAPVFELLPGLIEWLGAVSLQCKLQDDTYISTMNNSVEHEMFGQVVFLSFTGLLSMARIKKIISQIQQLSVNSSSSWISMYVQGFEDSVIKNEKNNLLRFDGEQNYTIFFRKNDSSLFCSFHNCIKGK